MTRPLSLFHMFFILFIMVVLNLVVLKSLLKTQLNVLKQRNVTLKYMGVQTKQFTSLMQTEWDVKKPNTYPINCRNINTIHIVTKDIGGGRSKTIDIGFYKGKKIVIKRLSGMKRQTLSKDFRQLLFLKEILIREQLDHPGLIKMYGYCVEHLYHESYKDRQKFGIAAVYEHGYEIDVNNSSMSIDDRLKYVLQVAELLVYLQHSPLGSLILGDFAVHHFLIVDGNIKLIDMDYIHKIEPPCKNSADCLLNVNCFQSLNETCNQYDGCKTGLCIGYNAKYNLAQVNENFIKHLLNLTYFKQFQHILHMVDSVHFKLSNNLIDAIQLVREIKYIISGRFRSK